MYNAKIRVQLEFAARMLVIVLSAAVFFSCDATDRPIPIGNNACGGYCSINFDFLLEDRMPGCFCICDRETYFVLSIQNDDTKEYLLFNEGYDSDGMSFDVEVPCDAPVRIIGRAGCVCSKECPGQETQVVHNAWVINDLYIPQKCYDYVSYHPRPRGLMPDCTFINRSHMKNDKKG